MSNIPDHIRRGAAARAAEPPSADKLDRVRRAAAQLRELYEEKETLEEHLGAIQAKITSMETKELVDVLTEAKMPSFDLEAEGNQPAVHFEKKPFYSARIPDDRQAEAFAWLEAEGHADLIKTEFKVNFGMGEYDLSQKLDELLTKMKFPFAKKTGVLPQSLTAWVKREVEKNHVVPADLLGVFVGEVVKVKFSAAKAVDKRGED